MSEPDAERPTVYGLPARSSHPMGASLRELAALLDRGDLQVARGGITVDIATWVDGGAITITSDLVLAPILKGR